MLRWIKYVVFFCLIFIVSSCKVSRLATRAESYPGLSERKFIKSIDRKADFNTLEIGRFIAEYSNGTENRRFKGYVRLAKDSAIMISISPIMGIELFRILGSGDTLKFLDRYNKQFYIGEYGATDHLISGFSGFGMLQGALLAQAIVPDLEVNRHHFEEKEKYYVITDYFERGIKKLEISKMYSKGLLLKRVLVNDFSKGDNIEIKYLDYYQLDGDLLIPKNLQFKIFSGNKIEQLNLTFERVEINKDINLPFSVSKKYQRILSL